MKDRKLILLFYYYEAREWFLKMGGKWNCHSWVRNKNINCFNWRAASCILHTRTALELFVCNTHSLTSLPLLLKRKWTIHKLIISSLERAKQLVSPGIITKGIYTFKPIQPVVPTDKGYITCGISPFGSFQLIWFAFLTNYRDYSHPHFHDLISTVSPA